MKWDLGVVLAVAGATSMAIGDGGDRGLAAGVGLPFTEEALARGLNYRMRTLTPFDIAMQGFGIAIADLNGDGHQDLVLMGHASGMVGLFQNDGTGHFINRSFINLDPKIVAPHGCGISVADYNGDGLPDIYITQSSTDSAAGANILLRNNGGFNFTDVSAAAGVDNVGRGFGSIWGDFDNDGWLDLYVVNYTLLSQQQNPTYRNKLYRNNANGTFTDVSVGSNVDDAGAGLAAVFSDMNRDGWLDLYLANDKGSLPGGYPNRSWINRGGVFEDTCDTSGLCLGLWGMSASAGDVNGDGHVDYYVTNLPHPLGYHGWNPLFINQGDETFVEQCTEAGVCQFIFSWSAIFADLTNNGWLDLYVCNQTQPNALYANHGTFPLTDVAAAMNVIGNTGHSYNAALGDLTGDGTIDVVLNNLSSQGQQLNVQAFVNHAAARENWVRFHVVGHAGNRAAIGSSVQVTAGGTTQWRELYAGGNNYKSQNELVYHFGLGDALHAEKIHVTWPGGELSRTLRNYPANHAWTLYPPEMLGDGNGDGVIDVTDLLALLAAWGEIVPGREKLDLDGNGTIDVADLQLLLDQWNELFDVG